MRGIEVSQKTKILELLLNSPENTVSCSEFNKPPFFLYHKLSSRISDLKKMGYKIEFIKGDTIMECKYHLVQQKAKQLNLLV